MFDGKIPLWYHFMCFFTKQRPQSETDIAHFDSLRWEDQEKIRKKIGKEISSTITFNIIFHDNQNKVEL